MGLRREASYLGTNKIADSFLRGANSLIPRALRAVRVILADGTGGRSRVVSDLGCGVGSLVLEISLGFLGFAGILECISYLDIINEELRAYLVRSVTCQTAEGRLDSSRGGVNV
jgi:hypothetical protein